MEFVARTDVGKCRSENQDSASVFVHAGFVIGMVADGMGGHNGGATASAMAIACLKEELLQKLRADADMDAAKEILRSAYAQANAQIYVRAQMDEKLEGMGTTLTVALLRGADLLVANIGDSRAYIAEADGMRQLTVDQTLVQRLIDEGAITPQEAKTHPQRHVILEAVGTGENIMPDFYMVKLQGRRVLLCSDGLTGEVEDALIYETLQAAENPAQAAEMLIAKANAFGGGDNITVALLSAKAPSGERMSANE